ncbi:2Fe-2S iron-sulfur cluster-binding protein [Yoonia sp. R2-816]|uniref:2Fe-2S iron-sulfur cluster-binding protein n=1 Tax=Yoonia sp. R2-816 TaxID=3342638 RepID=UPI00372A46A8
MAQFHPLVVTDIHRTIRDAVVLTLQPEDPEAFDFIQGQYLTFRHSFDGEELRRSYSICAGKDDGMLQVGIKKVDGGAFSTWANTALKVGDRLEAMPPKGQFHVALQPGQARHYLGFAGGSGITPILSILRTMLEREPSSQFTLVYANRAVNSIMFREELGDLKNRFMARLNIIHVLEQNADDSGVFTGRVDAEKCALLFKHWISPDDVDVAFICGPEPMMLTISDALQSHGLPKDKIKFELFASGQPGRLKRPVQSSQVAQHATSATVTLDGESRSFDVAPDQSLLEAALANNIDAPFACKAGVCSTCRAKLTQGEVEMVANHALEDGEVSRGYILTCQSYPLTDKVAFDYDSH